MSSLEPGLLTNDELIGTLEKKGVALSASLTRSELVQLYLKHIQPQPQRTGKKLPSNKATMKTSTSLICLKTKNISLSEGREKRLKRFEANEPMDMGPCSSVSSEDTSHSYGQVIQKRPNLVPENESKSTFQIKKIKWN